MPRILRRLRLLLACLMLALAFVPPASQLDVAHRALAHRALAVASPGQARAAPPIERDRAAAAQVAHARAPREEGSKRPSAAFRWPAPLVPARPAQVRSSHEPSFDGRWLYIEHSALLC